MNKQPTQAIKCFKKAKIKNPTVSDLYDLWGSILLSQGKYSKIIAQYESFTQK